MSSSDTDILTQVWTMCNKRQKNCKARTSKTTLLNWSSYKVARHRQSRNEQKRPLIRKDAKRQHHMTNQSIHAEYNPVGVTILSWEVQWTPCHMHQHPETGYWPGIFPQSDIAIMERKCEIRSLLVWSKREPELTNKFSLGALILSLY